MVRSTELAIGCARLEGAMHHWRRKKTAFGLPAVRRNRVDLLISAAVGLATLASVVTWIVLPTEGRTGEAPTFRGGPRLAVDKELIDFGTVRYDHFVEARFRLKNVGDQPLRLPASPPIEVVEGC
jgi:hypothetical protein